MGFFSKKKCRPLADAGGALGEKYRAFRGLLSHNRAALKGIADLEALYYSGRPFSLTEIRIRYEVLLEAMYGIVYSMAGLSPQDHSALSETVARVDRELFANFNPKCSLTTERLVLPLSEVTHDMKPSVGAKAVHLAVIRNDLGLPAPEGFAVTAFAFETFIRHNRLLKPIHEELSHIPSGDVGAMDAAGARIQERILAGEIPPALADELLAAYRILASRTKEGVRIAVRSSAVGEDTEATFAGQYESVLNVREDSLLTAYKQVLASKYSARAISYRLQHGLDDRETPMCVVCLEMVEAKASGVIYSVDPSLTRSCPIKINAVWGLGELLVSGGAAADVFMVDRVSRTVLERRIARKEHRSEGAPDGGTRVFPVTHAEQDAPSLADEAVLALAGYALLLEEFFGSPQDIEWAMDRDDRISILQSRPLNLPEARANIESALSFRDHPVLFSGGAAASYGVAAGPVFILQHDADLGSVPENSILVARTASPDLARVLGKIRGLITDLGSVTSHMASVAREFGIPAVVGAEHATAQLTPGEVVTLSADTATVYSGVVQELVSDLRPARKLIFDSPIHRRMRDILDKIAPLNLTNPASPAFAPEHCLTLHDVIRYTHETAVKEMFGMSGERSDTGPAAKLSSTLPLQLLLIDLGGGLRDGLTSCDDITPDDIVSHPMKAIWTGFSHPGVSWTGTMSINQESLSGLLAASATSEFGETPGGESYALVSQDYLNLSVRFAYHFALVDCLCGEHDSQNYLTLQFSGGAGSYYGRSLRIQLVAGILGRLGFRIAVNGDLLEASIARHDRKTMEEKLDLVGRLLVSCRLLDMTLTSQEEVAHYGDAFFAGDYHFLPKKEPSLPGFYTHGGHWTGRSENGRRQCFQDGAKWGRRLSSEFTGIMGKVLGAAYRDFLDTMEAYHSFPIAVLKDHVVSDGTIRVRVKPASGKIDQAGGIIFGMKDLDNYFVLRINALEDNIILFEFRNGRRLQRQAASRKIRSAQWHLLRAVISGSRVRGYLKGEEVLAYDADRPLRGFVGLWTKADSSTYFEEFILDTPEGSTTVEF